LNAPGEIVVIRFELNETWTIVAVGKLKAHAGTVEILFESKLILTVLARGKLNCDEQGIDVMILDMKLISTLLAKGKLKTVDEGIVVILLKDSPTPT